MLLRARCSSDAFDLVLQGMEAAIDCIEVAPGRRVRVAVLVGDDPGRDPGVEGRPGHHFVYDARELDPLPPAEGRA